MKLDNRLAVQYNKKDNIPFLHKNFPPENESRSEAHRLATWWASREDVETGAQALISMNGQWYMVEKFDDADNHYQVEAPVTEREYIKILREIKDRGRYGQIRFIQGNYDRYDKLDKSSDSNIGAESGSDSAVVGYGRENSGVVRMDTSQDNRRERTERDGARDSAGGSEGRQGNTENRVDSDSTNAPIRIYDGKLSESGEDSYLDLRRAVRNLSRMTGASLNVSIVTPNEAFKGVTVSGNNIYVAADVLENGRWAPTLIHEVTHLEEGTKEYAEFAAALLGNKKAATAKMAELTSDTNTYGFSAETVERLNDKLDEKGERAESSARKPSVQYSKNEAFPDELKQWSRSGKIDGEYFVLGMTGDVLQGLGAIESDIYMSGDKIKQILREHSEITLDEIKRIPDILEDPVLILKSKNVGRGNKNNTRLVIFGSVKGQNGLPILSVLDLRPVEKNLVIDDMQKITSSYTKTQNPVEFIQSSDIVYADKKRATKLLTSIGFQMPIELQQSGYIGSISYFKLSVNISGKKFSEVFGIDEKNNENNDGAAQASDVKESEKVNSDTKKSQADVSDVEFVSELIAGLAEDSVGTAGTFIDSLVRGNDKLTAKILNKLERAIEYLESRKSADARAQYRQARDLQKKFLTALEATGKRYVDGSVIAADDEEETIQFSRLNSSAITEDDVDTLKAIGSKSVNEFSAEDIQKSKKWAEKFYSELGIKSPFFRAWFGDWRVYDNTPTENIELSSINASTRQQADTYIKDGLKNRTLFRGNVNNSDSGFDINIGAQVYNDTLTYANRQYSRDKNIKTYLSRISLLSKVREITETAVLLDTETAKRDGKNTNKIFVHRFYTIARIDNTHYLVKLTVDELNSDGASIRRAYNVDDIEISPVAVSRDFSPADTTDDINGENISTISISDLFAIVKTYDKKFSPKPVDRILVNEDGTPKVFYHGTNERFSAFSVDEIAAREGSFFFAENREDARAYGDNIFEVYLTGDKFADYDNQDTEFYHLRNKREQVAYLKERGYDGWYSDMDSGGWGEVSVFSPTQIKSAVDNIGTFDRFDPDIRFSRKNTSISEGTLIKQKANFQGEKVFDKSSVSDAMSTIDVWSRLPVRVREELTERLWQGFNQRRDNQGWTNFEFYKAKAELSSAFCFYIHFTSSSKRFL